MIMLLALALSILMRLPPGTARLRPSGLRDSALGTRERGS